MGGVVSVFLVRFHVRLVVGTIDVMTGYGHPVMKFGHNSSNKNLEERSLDH